MEVLAMALSALCRALMALLLILGIGVAASCSAAPEHAADSAATASATTATRAAAQRGDEKHGGLPFEVGEWDLNDPNFRFFDPCTEIPAEVFMEAGLGEKIGEVNFPEGNYSTCFFRVSLSGDVGGELSVSIFSDLVRKDKYKDSRIAVLEDADARGMSLVRDLNSPEGSCATSMVTNRGRWGVDVASVYGIQDGAVCDHAKEIHNKIIERI
ncbi:MULTISPECIES: DUF3558 family protein [unclassified Corynebacterium]|uniref:DUF3558 family protein n=1 Tax=unclassified Corynebacterium TaxID=2624378 RepID=UPI001D0E743B|nr:MULTISPECIES: DUF3558 family protein [unclassified Corynebacterium]